MEHPKVKVTLKDGDKKEEFTVNSTPANVLKELAKPPHERSHFVMAEAHDPYYDPNIHDLVEEDNKKKVKGKAEKATPPKPVITDPKKDDDEVEEDDD